MSNSKQLTDDQKKICKRVEILGKTFRTRDNEAIITFDVYQGGGIEEAWGAGQIQFSTPNGNHYENYEPYYDLIKNIIYGNEEYFLNPFYSGDYGDSDEAWGLIEPIYNFKDKVISFVADVRYYEPNYQETDDEFEDDVALELIGIKNETPEMEGDIFSMRFDGGGDSGYIDSGENEMGDSCPIPSKFEDMGYTLLGIYYGGWEINEGSYGKIYFNFSEENKVLWSIEMNMNEEQSDTHHYDLKISTQ